LRLQASHQYQHQVSEPLNHHDEQQQTTAKDISQSDDTYSSDFSSISSAEDEEHHEQEPDGNQLSSTSDSQPKSTPVASSPAARNSRQRGRGSTVNTSSEKRVRTSASRGFQGSPTRSRPEQSQRKQNPELGLKKKDENVGLTGKKLQGRLRQGSSSPKPDSEKTDEEGGKIETNGGSMVRDNHEFHLKYTENDDIRQWLRSKNAELRQQRKEKKRVERARRRELQQQKQAKEQRLRESEMVVQKWMEEKKMLSRRQQQKPKTLQNGMKPAKDEDGPKDADLAHCGDKLAENDFAPKAAEQQGKDTSGKLKVQPAKYNTLPRADAWNPPGKKMAEPDKRKAYRHWLEENRTEGQSRLDMVKGGQKGQPSSSPRCVPHPPGQGFEKQRRCTSARVGRRKAGEGPSPRLQGRRPRSGPAERIGARLEPQGADGLDPVQELDTTVVDDRESVQFDMEVQDLEALDKDQSGYTVPNASSEFEGGKTASCDPSLDAGQDDDLLKVTPSQESKVDVDTYPDSGLHSSHDIMGISTGSETNASSSDRQTNVLYQRVDNEMMSGERKKAEDWADEGPPTHSDTSESQETETAEKTDEGQKRGMEDHSNVHLKMRSSRDLMNIISRSESRDAIHETPMIGSRVESRQQHSVQPEMFDENQHLQESESEKEVDESGDRENSGVASRSSDGESVKSLINGDSVSTANDEGNDLWL